MHTTFCNPFIYSFFFLNIYTSFFNFLELKYTLGTIMLNIKSVDAFFRIRILLLNRRNIICNIISYIFGSLVQKCLVSQQPSVSNFNNGFSVVRIISFRIKPILLCFQWKVRQPVFAHVFGFTCLHRLHVYMFTPFFF